MLVESITFRPAQTVGCGDGHVFRNGEWRPAKIYAARFELECGRCGGIVTAGARVTRGGTSGQIIACDACQPCHLTNADDPACWRCGIPPKRLLLPEITSFPPSEPQLINDDTDL